MQCEGEISSAKGYYMFTDNLSTKIPWAEHATGTSWSEAVMLSSRFLPGILKIKSWKLGTLQKLKKTLAVVWLYEKAGRKHVSVNQLCTYKKCYSEKQKGSRDYKAWGDSWL